MGIWMTDMMKTIDNIGDLGWFALALIAVQIIPAPKKNQLFLTLEFDLRRCTKLGSGKALTFSSNQMTLHWWIWISMIILINCNGFVLTSVFKSACYLHIKGTLRKLWILVPLCLEKRQSPIFWREQKSHCREKS